MTDHFTHQKVAQFFSQFPVEEHPDGTILIHAGEKRAELFWIESGYVQMRSTSAQGGELYLHLFTPGACFSLLGLTTNFEHDYDYICASNVKLRRAPAERAKEFLLTNPAVLYMFLTRMLSGLDGLLHRIQQTAFASAYERVAGVLVFFSRHFGTQVTGGTQLSHQFTHQAIASWLGLSRENVTLQLGALEDKNIIRQANRQIIILDSEKLLEIARHHVTNLHGFIPSEEAE